MEQEKCHDDDPALEALVVCIEEPGATRKASAVSFYLVGLTWPGRSALKKAFSRLRRDLRLRPMEKSRSE